MAKGYSMAQSWLALVGRILISPIFIISRIRKLPALVLSFRHWLRWDCYHRGGYRSCRSDYS